MNAFPQLVESEGDKIPRLALQVFTGSGRVRMFIAGPGLQKARQFEIPYIDELLGWDVQRGQDCRNFDVAVSQVRPVVQDRREFAEFAMILEVI